MADNGFFTISTYIKYATIPSAVILLVLSFLQRRARPNKCGYHYPGLVVPMHFLDGYEDRWSYALCFGAIATVLISVFSQTVFSGSDQNASTSASDALFCGNSKSDACQEVWIKTMLLQVQSLVASLVCAPHFACITTAYKLVGALLGFAYSIYWIVFYIVGAVNSEKYYDRTLGTLRWLRDVPTILCFVGLCIRSVWTTYQCYKAKRIRVQVIDNVVERHQVDHVTSLFQKPPEEPPPPESLVEKIKVKLQPRIFPHFKLPNRIISIAFVQIIIIYYIGVTMSQLGVVLRRELKVLLAGNSTNETSTVIDIFEGVYVSAEALGLLSSAIYIALFVINYRINMINIYKGNKHTYLDESQSTSKHVAQSLRLPGYQIAYIVWGFLIIFFVLLMIVGAISFGIYFLDQIDYLGAAFQYLVQTLSVPVTTLGVFYLQVLLVRLFLLQPKLNKEDDSPPLNIDNRRLYEVVSYVLIFNNLVVGLASALFRTAKSFILGVIFLGRLDRCLLMKGFETMDPGYMAYVGTLLVDNAHNNPVMRVFCALLLRLTCKENDKMERGIRFLVEPQRTGSNSRAARRWHLAYTLLHNPDLLPRRKLALLLTRGMESDDGDDDENKDNQKLPGASKRRDWQRLWSLSVQLSSENSSKRDNSAVGPDVTMRLEKGENAVDGRQLENVESSGYMDVEGTENRMYFEMEKDTSQPQKIQLHSSKSYI